VTLSSSLIFLQFLQDVELVWGNAMLYNPSDNVVHKDAVFMRNIWHQQTLKYLAKEVTFEISANCTSTPDTRLQVFLAWAQEQFEKLFPPPATLELATTTPVADVVPSSKKLKAICVDVAQEPTISALKAATPNSVVRLSFQSSKTSTSSTPDNSATTIRVAAVHSPLPSKAVAPVQVSPFEVAATPASKLFDISAVPVVKVSGPLLRSCSKALSTITNDPDMIWFVSPGKNPSLLGPANTLACAS
jgi:hypothetical protein